MTANGDRYHGTGQLILGDRRVDVVVTLRGGFQPIDGRYHWYGRIRSDDAVDRLADSGDRVALRTPHGEAEARLSDVDPWGRYRIMGLGRPPFPTGAEGPASNGRSAAGPGAE